MTCPRTAVTQLAGTSRQNLDRVLLRLSIEPDEEFATEEAVAA